MVKWTDVEEIGFMLGNEHPDVDPLTIRFTALHKWVTELKEFDDDPKKSNERVLEAIQSVWLEEFYDRQEVSD